MVELKRLFALMLASDRKYLNPSTSIEVLKHSFSSGEASQAAQSSNGQQVYLVVCTCTFSYGSLASQTVLCVINC